MLLRTIVHVLHELTTYTCLQLRPHEITDQVTAVAGRTHTRVAYAYTRGMCSYRYTACMYTFINVKLSTWMVVLGLDIHAHGFMVMVL